MPKSQPYTPKIFPKKLKIKKYKANKTKQSAIRESKEFLSDKCLVCRHDFKRMDSIGLVIIYLYITEKLPSQKTQQRFELYKNRTDPWLNNDEQHDA